MNAKPTWANWLAVTGVLAGLLIAAILWAQAGILPMAGAPIPTPTMTATATSQYRLQPIELPTWSRFWWTPTPRPTPSTPEPTPTPDPRFAVFEHVYGLEIDRWCLTNCLMSIHDLRSGQLVTLGDFVGRVGAPDKVYVYQVNRGVEQQSPPYIGAKIYFITRGFAIEAARDFDQEDEITPGMRVIQLRLFKSRREDDIALEESLLGGQYVWAAEAWKGFGPVKVHR